MLALRGQCISNKPLILSYKKAPDCQIFKVQLSLSSLTAADRDRSQTHVQDLSVNNLGHNVSVTYFLTSAYFAWNCAVHHSQVRNVLVN